MKEIITAIGTEELNNILKNINGICIKNKDIQYQEGIIEALEKYQTIDILILKDQIIGELDLEELIDKIIMLKETIHIILIVEEQYRVNENRNIVKIINSKSNYVKEVLKYLTDKSYIKIKKATNKPKYITLQIKEVDKLEKNNAKLQKEKRYIEKIRKNDKESVVVIGNAGVRKNNFYFYII